MNLSLKIVLVMTTALIMSGCTVYQHGPSAHKPHKKVVKVVTPALVTEHNSLNIIIVKAKPTKQACTKHDDHWHCKAH
ncbi:hypothetical protein I6F65_09435 [Pseudoalteromonas sp. SWXJZ94C]|uniref:hypothetical protein n=1 Tax=Pseudoalteromonas sp. SWXJZ94C TaxID=2792065 RepID=UPI0018CDA2E9|nr:hypothetical protein [Pseudoalteromonas sp. SWXJZ94C]MBH0057185.1 hypothetical protein [Pseudoalteromonas sp. SWXJZ94C]